MYKGRNITPKEGQLCICRCPGWNEEGYQVAKFEFGEFSYSDQPNNRFDDMVIAYLPLNENGEPIK